MNLAHKYKTLLSKNGLTSQLRLAHFFAQIDHESGLKPIQENLNYTALRLREVFPKYFDLKTSEEYKKQPEKIANRVYANRMGNGDEASGDGFRYSGKGFIQLTGRDSYKALSEDTGIDYLNCPELLLNEADSMISAIWFWNKHNLNDLADLDEVSAITRKINGGQNGLAHRQALLSKYKKFFEYLK